MAYCNGNVDDKRTTQVQIKRGPKAGSTSIIHGISVDGQWYDCGFKDPKVEMGAEVSFNHEFNYGKNVIAMETFTQGNAPEKADSTQPVAAAPVAATNNVKDVAVSRERSIIRQNSLAHAVKAVVIMVDFHDGAPDDDALLAERIIEMAYKFEEYSSGQREVIEAKKLTDGS